MDLVSELFSIYLTLLALILSPPFNHCQNNGETEGWLYWLANPWITSYTLSKQKLVFFQTAKCSKAS